LLEKHKILEPMTRSEYDLGNIAVLGVSVDLTTLLTVAVVNCSVEVN